MSAWNRTNSVPVCLLKRNKIPCQRNFKLFEDQDFACLNCHVEIKKCSFLFSVSICQNILHDEIKRRKIEPIKDTSVELKRKAYLLINPIDNQLEFDESITHDKRLTSLEDFDLLVQNEISLLKSIQNTDLKLWNIECLIFPSISIWNFNDNYENIK